MPQCHTIEILSDRCGISMNELSRELGIAVSTLTRICDILVRDNLIIRRDNPQDRRQVCIELTETGRGIALTLRQCSTSYCQTLLDNIPEEQRDMVVQSLKLLYEAIDLTKQDMGYSCKTKISGASSDEGKCSKDTDS